MVLIFKDKTKCFLGYFQATYIQYVFIHQSGLMGRLTKIHKVHPREICSEKFKIMHKKFKKTCQISYFYFFKINLTITLFKLSSEIYADTLYSWGVGMRVYGICGVCRGSVWGLWMGVGPHHMSSPSHGA